MYYIITEISKHYKKFSIALIKTTVFLGGIV